MAPPSKGVIGYAKNLDGTILRVDLDFGGEARSSWLAEGFIRHLY